MRDIRPTNLQQSIFAAASVFFAASAWANESLIIDNAGNIGNGPGIFSSATGEGPSEAVDVRRSGAASRFQLTSYTDSGSQAPQVIQRRSRGTATAAFPLQPFENLGLFSFRGMEPDGTFTGSRASMTVQTTEAWSNSANGTRILFSTTANGTDSLLTRMVITDDGDIEVPAGNLVHASSRTLKRDIAPVDPDQILDRVLSLPLASWRYDRDTAAGLHLGPMAEDFYAVFGLGSDERTIAASDVSGVALAAIQGLKAEHDRKLAQKQSEITSLRSEVATLRARITALEERQAAASQLQNEVAGLRAIVHRLAAKERLAAVH